MVYILIHGLGQDETSWNQEEVASTTPRGGT